MRIGFVGWRGMVGSVLTQRMLEEHDFDHIEPTFFTTSNVGGKGPAIGRETPPLKDAADLKALGALEAIVTCQGGDYSNDVLPKLRAAGWTGYWIDAASALRMKEDAVIILDPVNRDVIDAAYRNGVKNFIGGNCTVTLMMMALAGLFRHDLIEWMTCMTYQSASGAGAQNMRELLVQMGEAHMAARDLLQDPASAILDIDREVAGILRDPNFPKEHFGVPLAGSLIPWIDRDLGNGMSREEWKGGAETNKILGAAAGLGQEPDPGRFDLRAHRRDALPQPGAHDQAAARCSPRRNRGDARRRQRVGARRSEHQRGISPSPHARRGYRIARGSDRAAAQARHGRRIPGGVHRGRPIALGRRRAVAAHGAHTGRTLIPAFVAFRLRLGLGCVVC